jgi:large subunit ribosomal protein L5
MSAANPMLEPRITKVTVHIGVGEGGERLQQAERVLNLLTGGSAIRSVGKTTNRELKIREGAPIGCKVTMRNQVKIKKFLEDAFWVREKTLPAYNVDSQGNLSFGIADYTDFPEMKYDPDIGIFGMDINVVLERPGHRVSRRRRTKRKVAASHRLTKSEGQSWLKEQFGLTLLEE